MATGERPPFPAPTRQGAPSTPWVFERACSATTPPYDESFGSKGRMGDDSSPPAPLRTSSAASSVFPPLAARVRYYPERALPRPDGRGEGRRRGDPLRLVAHTPGSQHPDGKPLPRRPSPGGSSFTT